MRGRLQILSNHFVVLIERFAYLSAGELETAIDLLRPALQDPIHFGDNSPHTYFDNAEKTLAVPSPRFNYVDLLSYGSTGPDGFDGFKKAVGLSPELSWATVNAAVVLLLIDSAIEFMDHGDYLSAAAEAMDAMEWGETLFNDLGYEAREKEYRREFARKGGIASTRESDGYKSAVLKEWDTGRFAGNKSAAARWGTRQYPIKNQETVRKWLRAHDKQKRRRRHGFSSFTSSTRRTLSFTILRTTRKHGPGCARTAARAVW
jgi:hypothetical protein